MSKRGEFLRILDPHEPLASRRYNTVADFSDWQLGGINAVKNTYRFEELIADFKKEKKGEQSDTKQSE